MSVDVALNGLNVIADIALIICVIHIVVDLEDIWGNR